MLVDKITLQQALELESLGEITIYDPGSKNLTGYHPREQEWKDNYYQLRTKAPTLPRNKIPEYYQSRYLIEIDRGCTNTQTSTIEWKYLRGINNKPKETPLHQEVEYVYILINPNYKDLIKIGMTSKTPERRLEQINGTGTVYVWELKFALPVKVGHASKVENQVHKYFQHLRHHAKNYNDREMFKVDVFQAIDKIREVGGLFQAGTPILY